MAFDSILSSIFIYKCVYICIYTYLYTHTQSLLQVGNAIGCVRSMLLDAGSHPCDGTVVQYFMLLDGWMTNFQHSNKINVPIVISVLIKAQTNHEQEIRSKGLPFLRYWEIHDHMIAIL